MRRRDFLGVIGGAAAWPVAAQAQKPALRIGFLYSGAANSFVALTRIRAIGEGLRNNDLIDGRDYTIEARFAAGHYERFPELAKELAQAGVSVILTNTIASVRAAQHLVPPVPIVMLPINDPVGAGLISSLARPGGYTTGLASLNEDLTPKLLEYESAIVPKATLLAALFNPANPSNPKFVDELRSRASVLGVSVRPVALQSPELLDAAFATIMEHPPDALQVIADSGLSDLSDRIAALALANRLPSFATSPIYAECGGLLAYGFSSTDFYARAGYYVKRILEGANPGELPVEQPTRIELWINLKTAGALGLDIPINVQRLADQVIE
jgi:putative tryptophan/tyrosine transport system substrate-binding protein